MKVKDMLKVAILIDHRPNHASEVGGLAGTWEKIARVAEGRGDLDLTLFFLGDRPGVARHASNVRSILLPPVLGTERLPFLNGIPTHTDLAPFHPALFSRLSGFDILHTTSCFYAFAKTAYRKSLVSGVPLVTSIQTDSIGWARIYTPMILGRLLPPSVLRLLIDDLRLLDIQERFMERGFGRYMRQCEAVFASHGRDVQMLKRLAPCVPVHHLRRGLDLNLFNPDRRDRDWMERRFGVPKGKLLLLFVGRIDAVKGAEVVAAVVKGLLEKNRDVHLLVVGNGALRKKLTGLLGGRATFTGNLPHSELGRIYAGADLLLSPSEAEVWPNVIMEARACGLAVAACQEGARHVMAAPGVDGVLLPNRDPAVWIGAVDRLLDDPSALRVMGRRARLHVEKTSPSWRGVLEEDLLPVWESVHRLHASHGFAAALNAP